MFRFALSVLLAASLALTGCQQSEQTSEETSYPSGPVTMTAGANPGSGFDITIRAVVEALQREQLVDVPLPVENRPGNSGAAFLAEMVEQYRGKDNEVSVTSLSMMMNELLGKSTYGYDDVTMIARLITEYYVVVTRPDSPYNNLGDVMSAIKSDAGRVVVGAANDDQAPFDLLVASAGGDASTINYVPFEGGGDQISALEKGDISVAIGGVSEFVDLLKAGTLRPLGVLSEERLPDLDVPTAREQGFDVTLSNWRGLYGPPEMPQVAVEFWQNALGKMVESPTWQQIAKDRHFTTTFMIGDEFQTFLAETQADVRQALAL
ncbi:Bug family tripartite tricarboxylate transporter substrate binding protein [Mycolicibacterium gadium]|uniref:Tripartite tricarboxylate transporter substrate binding protein n=1 Tax=Mycolicibacterium gadium TaxID=1794 RepID=A0ABT6GQB0_MYCGU|nr:tripartite tricarboxylate transporter substrate-binding protein [Mycolicibacterium gadium]MDG5483388.1 tripartite tricarboxylate transporter substrate binding protein [Mycolicibacterium gadium]